MVSRSLYALYTVLHCCATKIELVFILTVSRTTTVVAEPKKNPTILLLAFDMPIFMTISIFINLISAEFITPFSVENEVKMIPSCRSNVQHCQRQRNLSKKNTTKSQCFSSIGEKIE